MRSFCFAIVALLVLASNAFAQTAEVTQQTVTHYNSQFWGAYDDIRWHAQGTVPANESGSTGW